MTAPKTTIDIDEFLAYEHGEMGPDEVLDFFARLVVLGLAWTLQGSYGRQAAQFIESGYITEDGEVTDRGREAAEMA
jgi:hypothetical protein